MTKNIGVTIKGVGFYIPEKVLTNRELESIVDTSEEWILSRTGIAERRIASPDEVTSDLAFWAAKEAIADAAATPKDIDLIIIATATPDMIFPSTACFVQHKLGARNAAAFDISAACSGFIYGLSVAEQYIKSGKYKNILLIGAEIFSSIIDWEDRSTCVLFGDGAGAAVLSAKEVGKGDIFSTHIYSDGAYTDLLCVPGGGTKHPINHDTVDKRLHYLKMEGSKIFKTAIKKMGEALKDALTSEGLKPSDISLVIPHQANIRIINALAESIGFPMEKVFVNAKKYGNTSAASIPIALAEAVQEGRLKRGDIVAMVAFGGGLTWGSAILKW